MTSKVHENNGLNFSNRRFNYPSNVFKKKIETWKLCYANEICLN